MITAEYSENLCNMIFKSMLDAYNNEPNRQGIINLFSKEFENVRLTQYDDVIVFLEIENQVVFISQLGIFRYFNIVEEEYLSLKDYISIEYFKIAISMDMYCIESDISNDTSPLRYRVVPLLGQNKDGNLTISDLSLKNDFLNNLYESMSLYNSVLKVARVCYPEIL